MKKRRTKWTREETSEKKLVKREELCGQERIQVDKRGNNYTSEETRRQDKKHEDKKGSKMTREEIS